MYIRKHENCKSVENVYNNKGNILQKIKFVGNLYITYSNTFYILCQQTRGETSIYVYGFSLYKQAHDVIYNDENQLEAHKNN